LQEGNEIHRFDDYNCTVYSIVFANNGKQALSGDAEGGIRVLDLDTGTVKQRWQAHIGQTNCVAVCPQGSIIASGGTDNRLCFWDPVSQRELLRLVGHEGPVRSIAFSPHGTCIASGSYDKTVRLWDIDTGTELHRYDGHLSRIECLVFAPDGARILSCGWDGTVRSWQMPE
jgi:WD40 repeat protein